MNILSHYARKKKVDYFLKGIPKNAKILEIGCGSGFNKNYLINSGRKNYMGLDLVEPADIVGDILEWKTLGIQPESYDVIIAFEVVEHVDCFKECYDILKPGGVLMITTPVPNMDWFLYLLEILGLNQRRTSPHNNLIDLRNVEFFQKKNIKIMSFLSQWAIFTKTK